MATTKEIKKFGVGSGVDFTQQYPETHADAVYIDETTGETLTQRLAALSESRGDVRVYGMLMADSSDDWEQLKTQAAALDNNQVLIATMMSSAGALTGKIALSSDTYVPSSLRGKGAFNGDLLFALKSVLGVSYIVVPVNDAKAAEGDFPGCDGLETVWDKTQVNKIPALESRVGANDFPSRTGDNMNDNLMSGVYPWCTLGRPAGSDGAFTLVVKRTTTADNNGFSTVEQTAYGRENSVSGRIFKRIIFVKGEDKQYGEWIEIGRGTPWTD